jgi:hypothetical protein
MIPTRGAVLGGLLLCAGAWVGCAGTLDDPAAYELPDAGGAGIGDDAATADAGATPEGSAPACPDVPTVFAQSCGTGGCHDATTKAEALDLTSPNVAARLVGVAAVEGAGLLIDPSTPAKSVVYTKLLSSPPFGARMPTTKPLDDATTQCVLAWVTSQASAKLPAGDSGATPPPDSGTGMESGATDGGTVAPFTTMRIAAGQTSAVTDAQGKSWQADADFSGGTSAVESTPVTIAGTDSSVLYNGQRYGNPSFSYQFAVPDGAYTVTLKFAELYVTGPGMRLFDVAIEGKTVESSFDIYATAGGMNTAVDRSYSVTVSGGKLQIDFVQGSIQFPKVDAIEIASGTGDGG